MAALVSLDSLADILGYDSAADVRFREAKGLQAVQLATSWLRGSVSAAVDEYPPREDLAAWALELAAMAYSNPEGLTSHTTADVTRVWSGSRRTEILAAAASAYPGTAGSGGGQAPRGSFPAPAPWPC